MFRGLIIFLLLFGCSPSSPEDFQAQSEVKCSELVAILENADTLEDLLKVENDLRKKFNEIARLMISARKYYEKHPSLATAKPNPSSGALLEELKRIYAIKGGREIIERAQSDAQLW